MKKSILSAIIGLTILALNSCAPVKFYSNSALISKSAAAVTDLSTLKNIPVEASSSSITELYEFFMANGATSVKKIEIR